MDRITGKPLEGEAHLRQSVADILTTPIGSRALRRDYGSRLPELIDQPFNALTQLRLFAAIAGALARWEPRLSIRKIAVAWGDRPGAAVVTLEALRLDTPSPQSLNLDLALPGQALALS